MEKARRSISRVLNCRPGELFFTSGATESNNWAIATAAGSSSNHIITSVIEHKSVLDACLAFQKRGGEVTFLPVDAQGIVSPNDIADAIRPNTSLVSIMLANNEIGTIQPVTDIAAITREAGVRFHCDATQAIGYLAPDFKSLGPNLISFSGHKIYGPKGIGALYIDKETQTLHGGVRKHVVRRRPRGRAPAWDAKHHRHRRIRGSNKNFQRDLRQRKAKSSRPEKQILEPVVQAHPNGHRQLAAR
uniref:cysteine desulfurase family protein n=1 Tax=Arthrobacter sp. Hiyo1 TaxID=1588020 RepID=UPI0030F3753A